MMQDGKGGDRERCRICYALFIDGMRYRGV